MGVKWYVIRDILKHLWQVLKLQCLEVAPKLTVELHTCFPHHELYEALGIVYPHY